MAFRWIKEEHRGAAGGEYFHLDRGEKWVPIQDIAKESVKLDEKRVAYGVDADEEDLWYSIDFTANPNNRNFNIMCYRHKDFPENKPSSFIDYNHPQPIERHLKERENPEKILQKLKRSNTFKHYQNTIEQVVPEVKKLTSSVGLGSPGLMQALVSPTEFFISAAGQSKGSAKSIGNVKKSLQQLYEVEALRQGLGAKVKRGAIKKKG